MLGRCYPLEGMPCGRNVLIAEKTAHSIKSDCGRNGKCVNGKCIIDSLLLILFFLTFYFYNKKII